MKRYYVIAVVFLLVFTGCKVHRTSVSSTSINSEQKDSTSIQKEVTTVAVPKKDLQIFDVIQTKSDGTFKPIERTFKDSSTGSVVSYSVDKTGVLEIKSITPPDTIQKVKESTVNTSNNSINTSEDRASDFKGSLKLSEILSIAFGGLTSLIPGLGNLKYYGIIIFLIILILLMRRKKPNKESS